MLFILAIHYSALMGNESRSRLLAIGTRKDVTETIRVLHVLGYTEVAAWSPLLLAPNSAEVMSRLLGCRSGEGGKGS